MDDDAPPAIAPLRGQVGRLLQAAFEEGAFGLSHLAVHFVLARRLAPSDYAEFTLALVVAYLQAGLVHAFVVEPMLVLAAGKFANRKGYLGAVVLLHWCAVGTLCVVSSLLGLIASGLTEPLVARCLFLGVPATVGIAWMRFARAFGYVGPSRFAGVWASLVYVLGIGLGLGALLVSARASALTALCVLGAVGTAAGASVAHVRLEPLHATRALGEAWSFHVRFARWLVPLAPLRWAVDALPLLLVGFLSSLADVAALRAAMNFVAPPTQLFGAVRLALLPQFVRTTSGRELRRVTRWSLIAVVALGGGFAALVAATAPFWLSFYGRYEDAAPSLRVVAWLPALLGAALFVGNVLRARQLEAASFRAFAFAAVVIAGVGFLVVPAHGAWGGAISAVAGYLALLVAKAAAARPALRSD